MANWKYRLQKHRTKIRIAGSVLLFLVAVILAYLLLLRDKWDILDFGREHTLAEHVVSGDVSGKLSVFKTESMEKTFTTSLPKDRYLYAPGSSYDSFFAYNGTDVYRLNVEDGKIENEGVIAKITVEGAEGFRTDGKNIAVLSNDGQTITFYYENDGAMETEIIELQEKIHDYAVIDGRLYYAVGTELVLFHSGEETSIDLGDVTNHITKFQDKILIQNDFGSGLNNSILLTLEPENLLIVELEEAESGETVLIPSDEGDERFYTMHYVSGKEPFYFMYEWELDRDHLVKNKNLAIRVPVREDGVVYNHHTAVASKGYLYVHFNDKLKIFDIRSQDWHSEVSDLYEHFAMPVLD